MSKNIIYNGGFVDRADLPSGELAPAAATVETTLLNNWKYKFVDVNSDARMTWEVSTVPPDYEGDQSPRGQECLGIINWAGGVPPTSPAVSSAVITIDGNVATNATVTIGNKIYTFKTALTPTEGQVLIGLDADASLLNLIRAINHTGTPDTDYKCAAAHTQVTAAASVTAHAFRVTAILPDVTLAVATSSGEIGWSGAAVSSQSNYAYIVNRSANLRDCGMSKVYTLSFWAISITEPAQIAVEVRQEFGTGGSASVQVCSERLQISSTNYVRYLVTFSTPSIRDKTVVDADSALAVYIWTHASGDQAAHVGGGTLVPAAAALGLGIYGVQLEQGAVASDFEDWPEPTAAMEGEASPFPLASQAAGDIFYADSATTIARLAKATNTDILTLSSGLPAWTTRPAVSPFPVASQATGDLFYATSSTTIGRLAKQTNTDILSLVAGLPAWTAAPAVSSGLPLSGSAYIFVGGSTNSTTNGTALIAAYAAAKSATPHGAALSATNRYTIYLLNGVYTVTDGALVMDAEFIDIFGLQPMNGSEIKIGSNVLATGGTIIKSTGTALTKTSGANDARLGNFATVTTSALGSAKPGFVSTGAAAEMFFGMVFDATDVSSPYPCAYNIGWGGYYEDCVCLRPYGFSAGSGTASGVFVRCRSDGYSFGYGGGNATGVFIDCEAEGASFGNSATASGTFVNCRGRIMFSSSTGGMFGSAGTASGTFVNCDAGSFAESFGGGAAGAASGTFKNCRATGVGNFGRASASGTFDDCTSGAQSFGYTGTANGIFRSCRAGASSFGGSWSAGTAGTSSGTFINCYAGDYSFCGGDTGGTFSGVAIGCVGGSHCFAGGATTAGTLSGTVKMCHWTGRLHATITGRLEYCSVRAGANENAIIAGINGRAYCCVLVQNGSGDTIYAAGAIGTFGWSLCVLNKAKHANVTNAITTTTVDAGGNFMEATTVT